MGANVVYCYRKEKKELIYQKEIIFFTEKESINCRWENEKNENRYYLNYTIL